MRYLKAGGLALAAIVLAGLAFVILLDRLSQPAPPDPATFIAKAARYDVRIRRDNFGVPHVLGRTDADVAFGFGFAHSEDDFATIQDAALASRGQLAATEGLKAATLDYLVHLMRVWETIDAQYEKDLPADVRHVIEAYADGVNYYAALHPDKVKPGLLPLTGKDIAAGFVFKTPFFYGLDTTLRNVMSRAGGQKNRNRDRMGPRSRRRAPQTAPRGCSSIRISPMRGRWRGTRRCCKAARAGTSLAASFPALPSCCTATTSIWAGRTRSTRQICHVCTGSR